MRHVAALPLAALLLTAVPAAFAADDGPTKLSPLQIGQIFCIARVGNDMTPIEAIITASLKKAIAKAEALDAAWQKKNPGDEPPLGEGIPWQGHPDYTADCTAGSPTATDKEARIGISYAFSDAPSANYTDVLVLKPVADARMGDDVWRVDDVVFADKTDMRQQLIDAFKP